MKTCNKCGSSFDGSNCKPCRNEYMRAWSAKNADAVRARKRDLYAQNQELNRARRHARRDKRRAESAAWKAANQEHVRAYRKAYNERKRLAEGKTYTPGVSPSITHGMSKSRTYLAWARMKRRCFNPNHDTWKHYGGRGITVCDRWRDSFEAFLADMGEAPEGLTIERIDNDKNYEPGNCRWATQSEQVRNTRQTKRVEMNGETLCVTDWCARLGVVCASTALSRISRGWEPVEAITTPSRQSAA